jgi:hypothetical protein
MPERRVEESARGVLAATRTCPAGVKMLIGEKNGPSGAVGHYSWSGEL